MAKLRLTPFEIEVHRQLAQLCGLTHVGFKAHDSRIGKIEADIGAGGLAAQPDAPFAGLSCQKARSVLTSESGSFSAPLLKLMRESVASR